jgi:RHS repeat-associated protein
LVGDPVDTSKGAAVDETLDFRLIGPLDFKWVRYYDSSLSRRRLALGWGHTHDLDRTLRFDANGLRYVARVGSAVGFPPVLKNGDEVTSDGYRLRRLSLLGYEIHHHGEASIEFEFRNVSAPARPKRLFRGRDEIRFDYGPDGRWERIVDSMGRVVRVAEETDGRILSLTLEARRDKPSIVLVSYRYDERGNLIGTTDSSGHGFNCAYDAENRLIRRTGRKGFSFHFLYDAKGRCIKSAGDDRMHEVSLDYDPSGRITKVTRADGGVWTYVFDDGGRLARVIDPLGGVQAFISDETGRLIQEQDPNGNVTRVIYDTAGSAVAKITPFGHRVALPENPNARDPRVHRVAANPAEYEYGRLLKIDQITLPYAGEVAAMPIPIEARSLVVTRPVDRPLSRDEESFQPLPLGPNWWPRPKHGRVFNDLGKLVRQEDDWGRNRRWSYDASGNVAEYEDFDGGRWSNDCGNWHLRLGETNALGATVRASYNTSGELASFTDAGGTLSEYSYNLKDHLVEVKRHGVVRDKYSRDAAGNLNAKHAGDGRLLLQLEIGPGNVPVKRTLASGDEHTFEYDEAGRYMVAVTKKDRVEFSYDALGNRCLEKCNGRGVVHQFPGWRLPAESVIFGRFHLRYEWGADGTLIITDPGGRKHQIHLHSNGLVERRLSNGSAEIAQYDQQGRCLFKHARRGNAAWNRRYHWSGEGELLRVQDSRLGEIRHEYDAAHRLRSRILPDGTVEQYELDLADNLIRQPGLDSVFLQEGNRLAAVNGLSVSYNDRNHVAVRQTVDGPAQYAYDSRDQLVRIEMPGGAWEAEYDALGRRTRKISAGQTTEYHWNTDQLIAEVQPDGRLRLYLYADPLALSPVIFLDYSSTDAPVDACHRYFVFADQIGTPCLIEDESRTEVWRARIDPYGRAQIAADAKIEFNLRFPGHYSDDETGLHYNRFRYYDPALGRYLQSDPWGLGGGYNLYAYRTNPLLKVDVRGLGEEDDPECHPPAEDEEGLWAAMLRAPENEEEPRAIPWDQVEESRAAFDRAANAAAVLGGQKAVAAGGDGVYASGTEPVPGFGHVDPDGVRTGLDGRSSPPGSTLFPPSDPAFLDRGDPGSYNASHAEMKTATDQPGRPIGVSRPVCDNCGPALSQVAQDNGQPQVITDPNGTHVYHPDGGYDFLGWD